MFPSDTRLDASIPIPVLEPLRRVNEGLRELVKGFAPDDWHRPTVHPDRDVKDLTAHLLHGSLRRVSALRDHYRPPAGRSISTLAELIAFIQEDNREFMRGMRRVSPGILIEMLAVYDRELLALFEALDPGADGLGVAWAGEAVSRNWFDIAREYTEKWHHQQQLRDATGRPPLYEPSLFAPVLETFARGLPFAYRGRDAAEGERVSLAVIGPLDLGWTLRRSGSGWSLWSGADPAARTAIRIPADIAWRVWTRGMRREEARAGMDVRGDRALAEPVLDFVAIMA